MSKKINVLSITERLIPSCTGSVVRPMLQLQRNGLVNYRMAFSYRYTQSDIIWADVVVLCRNIKLDSLNIIELVQKYHKKLIYDIDDNFFELSISSPLGRFHRYPPHLYTLTELIKHSDAVRVYSKPMEEIASRINPSTYRLKSYFDFSLIKGITPKKHERVRIVYATSRGNTDTLAQICVPAVAKAMIRYPGLVEFYTFGEIPALLKGLKGVHKLKRIHDYSKYVRFFMKMGFDIGLAPLFDNRFCNSKTNNKFREYGAMRVCGIYSNAQIYRECVEDHQNGLIVNNTLDEWFAAICELVDNPELRARIKENAKTSVESNYSMENTIDDWAKLLNIPAAEPLEFKNFLNLKILVLYDGKSGLVNYRIHELTTLLGVGKIRYKAFDFDSAKLHKHKDYDLFICFISKTKDVNTWITTMRNFELSNIIVDTLLPFSKPADYPDVLFTNTEIACENSFAIPDLYSYAGVDTGRVTFDTLAVSENERSFSEIFGRSIDSINENEEHVFSPESPMFLWAELLSHYQTKYPLKKHCLMVKLIIKAARSLYVSLKKVSWFFVKIWNYTGGRVINMFVRLFGKIGTFAECVADYIKINILKKY